MTHHKSATPVHTIGQPDVITSLSQPTGTPSVSTSLSTVPASSAASKPPHKTTPAAPAMDPTISSVAMSFTQAWVNHTVAPKLWLANLKPYCTPQLYTSFTSSDPSNVPASVVTGRVKLSTSADGYVAVTIPTDTFTLLVSLDKASGRWLVDNVDTLS